MKIALLHDYLNQWGGGERVLQALCEIFPEADIYTLMFDGKLLGERFAGRAIKTSLLNFSLARKYHRAFIPLMPLAASLMKLENKYDLVISDSAGFGKGIAVPKGVKHISYCHSPLRYAWEGDYARGYFLSGARRVEGRLLKLFDKLREYFMGFAGIGFEMCAFPLLRYLRAWDHRAARKTDFMIANSRFIAGKIEKYYGFEAPVLYPPVDTDFWSPSPKPIKKDYYFAAARFLHYKKLDLVVEAFNRVKAPVKIVGTGPEEKRLKKMAKSPLIEFCGSVSDNELRDLYRGARAFIFPQVEDFGLTAAEAVACGTPVIAYAAGGALEIVNDGENGVFFNSQTPEAILAAIRRAEGMSWNAKAISASALKFSKENFKKSLLEAVHQIIG